MGRFVIVAYRPRPGREAALDALVEKHVRVLAEERLVTDRVPCVMKAADGTVVEVFEWASAEAIARAHQPGGRRVVGGVRGGLRVPAAGAPAGGRTDVRRVDAVG